jgi:hypothetical protein
MRYRFFPQALTELTAAADYYGARQEGLGAEFAVDVGLGIARILDAPRRWPELEPGIRKYNLDRIGRAQSIEIISVFDLRRHPGSWKRNLRA